MKGMIVTATIAAGLLGVASAQERGSLAVDLSGGTTGVSGHAQLGVHSRVALRMGYNWLDLSPDDEEISDVSYSGDVEFSGFGGFVDLHPFANAFTLTGGVFIGDKSVVLEAVPTEPINLGGEVFAPEDVGTLNGSAEFDDTAFFAGLGYDPSLYKQGKLSLIVRAGVMFTGEPDVLLDATAVNDDRLPPDVRDRLRNALVEEAEEIQDDVGDYGYYPILTLGLGYRF